MPCCSPDHIFLSDAHRAVALLTGLLSLACGDAHRITYFFRMSTAPQRYSLDCFLLPGRLLAGSFISFPCPPSNHLCATLVPGTNSFPLRTMQLNKPYSSFPFPTCHHCNPYSSFPFPTCYHCNGGRVTRLYISFLCPPAHCTTCRIESFFSHPGTAAPYRSPDSIPLPCPSGCSPHFIFLFVARQSAH